jgi:DNA-binding NtrC family response regulator
MNILLADDDAALRRVIQFKLKKRGYSVVAVDDGEQALAALMEGTFDLVLSDMKMPKLNGLDLLRQIKEIQPGLAVILMTAFAAVPQAVEAVKLGAFDYLTKPFDDDQLFAAIDKALKFRKLEQENKSLREQLQDRRKVQVVGVSEPIREVMSLVEKIAPTDATVLITGESGTGKEVIARTIHAKSSRAEGPFIAVNCAAIPRELLESELFGHVKGAFTGAIKDKKGRFELAEGGTILLDEISELSTELQAKLLRALQERVIDPVGSEKRVEIDVRVIVATNVNLKERVATGGFREDLFYRLNVIPLNVPPLRERQEDIPILVREFLQRFSSEHPVSVDSRLITQLKHHSWPGNIRELENLVERMVILRKSDTLTPDDLPADFDAPSPSYHHIPETERLTFHEAEKKLILEALDRFAWNKTRAAEYLNIPRHVLLYRMKKYSLHPHDRFADEPLQ